MNSPMTRTPLSEQGPEVNEIIFGTSALGNLYQILSYDEKLAIAREWFSALDAPVTLDSAGKYGAGLALEMIGRTLKDLAIPPDAVTISNKLGWKRVALQGAEPTFERGVWFGLENDAQQDFSRRGIIECWEQGNELLAPYEARIVSCHDPDEYLAGAAAEAERERRYEDILESYQALFKLKQKGYVDAVGVGAKDWAIIRRLSEELKLDWVMFACSYTIYRHPAELRRFMRKLQSQGTVIINSALFHAGFLTGGEFFDYRRPDPDADRELFDWRSRFFELCTTHEVKAAEACIEFGLAPAPISAVALNTAKASRVAQNVAAVLSRAPAAFWQDLFKAGMIEVLPSRAWPEAEEG